MKTRQILLPLADDTTDTECGSCPRGQHLDYPDMPTVSMTFCHAFRSMSLLRRRLPECIDIEAAAARMVEIAPEDALELCDTMLRHDFDMRLHHPAAQRAGIAIDTHADKARGKKEP